MLFLIPAASAGKMELSNADNKIILSIIENEIPIAAGRIYMNVSEPLVLYQPQGTDFFSNIYEIKGNNSDLELQFFSFAANSFTGRLEIPFSAGAGIYIARIEKIELYNKSDYLIPFDYPLETIIAVSPPTPPQQSGEEIGSGAGGVTIFPSTQPPTYPSTGSSGTGKKPEEKITNVTVTNKTEEQKKEEAKIPLPQIIIIFTLGAGILVILWLLISEVLHKITHHTPTVIQYK